MKKLDGSGNLLLAGVGGQGIILASAVVSLSLLKAGFDVKSSEVHGMAQRGGAVNTHLRYGKKVYSPVIEQGEVDILVAFEMMESARYLHYLHEDSRIVVNKQKIPPPSVLTGKGKYPDKVLEAVYKIGVSVLSLDAFEISKSLGETKTVNMVIVGAVSSLLPVEERVFINVISKRVPGKFLEVNLEAFKSGRRLIEDQIKS